MSITSTTIADERNALFVSMALRNWDQANKRLDDLLVNLDKDQFNNNVAPQRNRGIYLVGHLAAINDNLFTLFGIGNRLYPSYDKLFLSEADNLQTEFPPFEELVAAWHNVNTTLNKAFAEMSIDEWFSAHTAVKPEDFEKEPHRNKLNVLLSRTTHQHYHLGQLVFLKAATRG